MGPSNSYSTKRRRADWYNHTFTILVSILEGQFRYSNGWFIAGGFTMIVGLAMAEICSSYPTSCGLYYWSAKLAGPNLGPLCILDKWLVQHCWSGYNYESILAIWLPSVSTVINSNHFMCCGSYNTPFPLLQRKGLVPSLFLHTSTLIMGMESIVKRTFLCSGAFDEVKYTPHWVLRICSYDRGN
ncbi:hypothetical protein NC653_019818 [Populus alba x Populus x berolinensis]|uniref:Uncharacterized protein n=1 Tax=Populus alba x Populus x berolinensis TaxID=444605 RepID=A0AAD6QD45_9ROSI|nr:hypothetical protein NC653_019818 [Populus alba x Populus x berolinensis]